MAAELTEEAPGMICDIAHDPKVPAAVRLDALIEILNRGHGRPRQAADVTANTMPQVVEFIIPGIKSEKQHACGE